MKLLKIFSLFLLFNSCQIPQLNFGKASTYLPSKKILAEGIVCKYYVHQKKHDSEDISTHVEYQSYQVKNNKLYIYKFAPDYRQTRSKEYTFNNDKMILEKEVHYSKRDTFFADISKPTSRDWALQEADFKKTTFYNDGWKNEISKQQIKNIDTTYLDEKSKLFEGKTFSTEDNEIDTFKRDSRYKEIYTKNLGLTFWSSTDSTKTYWMELVEQIPLKLFKKQAKHGIRRVAYINTNKAIDKNENFELCHFNNYIYDYYNGGPKLLYKGGKKEIWNIFNEQLDTTKLFNESGYLTYRFIVNCNGKAGRFITEEADLDFKRKKFNATTTTHFYEILKEMTDWIPTISKGKNVDAYFYLTFKLEDGKLVELLP